MKENSVEMRQTFHDGTDKLHSIETKHCVRDDHNNVTKESGQLVDLLESSQPIAVMRPHHGVVSPDQTEQPAQHSNSNSQSAKCMENGPSTDDEGLIGVHKVEMAVLNGVQVRIVTLSKGIEPLGATVRSEGQTIAVARIMDGGMADKTKILKQGDEIVRVNGTDIAGKTVDEVAELMSSLVGKIEIVCKAASAAQIGSFQRHVRRREIMVRAQFDYDVHEDSFIPCVELGLSFQIGDILRVVNREDPHWWQALRETDEPGTLAGLIPSRVFWETREEVRRAILAESNVSLKREEKKSKCCPSMRSRHSEKKAAIKSDASMSMEHGPILTYEEVGALELQSRRKRPIVLVGCEELKLHKFCERMVSMDTARFAQPLMTSSRPTIISSDKNTPQQQYLPMEKFIEKTKKGEFVEHKVADEPEMHYVGVSKKAVADIINSGATCIMHCQPKNVHRIRTVDFKPYVVFIAAPPIQRLRNFLRLESTKEPTNDECKHVIDLSRHNESTYSHLYDYAMTFSDQHKACDELLAQINLVEEMSQWVPIDWLPVIKDTTNSSPSPERDSTQLITFQVSKQSVAADVELLPNIAEPDSGEASGDNAQLISLDSNLKVGADKWVEFL